MSDISFNSNEVEFQVFDDGSVDLLVGEQVPPEFEEKAVKTLLHKGLTEYFFKSDDGIKKRTFAIDDIDSDRFMVARKRWEFFRPEVIEPSGAEDKADLLIKSLLEKVVGQTQMASNRKNVPGLPGWSMDPSTGTMHHSTQGMIFTKPHTSGGFNIFHGARQIGQAPDIGSAGKHIRNYIQNEMAPGDVGMHAPIDKADNDEYWSKKSKFKQQKINREMERQPKQPGKPSPEGQGPGIKPTKLYDPDLSGKVNKSGYGPKGGGQYDPNVNIRRKSKNVSEERVPGVGGPSASVKAYSTKPGQLSGKAQAALMEARKKKLSGKGRSLSREEILRNYPGQAVSPMKKGWGQHLPMPNADEEVLKHHQEYGHNSEDVMANQLRNLMNNKAMLNPLQRAPTTEDLIMAGEEMGLGANEEIMKAEEAQWGNSINNWLNEAVKPISSRFASEEEELAYWNSIRVSDRPSGGDTGY